MIVGNPEGFKSWMTTVLEPMCDADPGALAKYVYALVKKDRPIDDLRKNLLEQLEVFLQKDTAPFVTLLFSKLETEFKEAPPCDVRIKEEPVDKAGSNEPSPPLIPPPLPPRPITAAPKIELPLFPDLYNSDGPEMSLEEAEDYIEKTNPDTDLLKEVNEFVKEEPSPTPPQADQGPSGLTSPKIGNGTTAALSKALEVPLPSSRYERKSDSEKEEKVVVRRSPERRRFERSRSRSRSWEHRSVTRRSRSRSRRSRSRGRNSAWRNKSPPYRPRFERDRGVRSSWSKSPVMRSRSRSPIKSRPRYRHRSRSPSFDSPRRCSSSPVRDSGHTHGEDLRHTLNQQIATKEMTTKKRRCRDYDEKGFCMRGEMCPYDHGNDPVVVEDVGQVLQTIHPPPRLPPALHPAAAAMPLGPINRPPPNLSEYNPDAPSMEPRIWSKPFRGSGRGMGRMAFPPRELISVPVVEREGQAAQYYEPHSLKRQCPSEFGNEMEPVMKQRFDYNRLGGVGGRAQRGNCSLHLRKIPSGLNNIAHLHNHFVKFGKIVNIQVSFEGDPEAALITFTSHAEASAAYKSTEAVLNNRFIKVFWYNPDKDVLMSGSTITKTVYIPPNLKVKSNLPKPEPKKMIVTANFAPNPLELQAAVARDVNKYKDVQRKEALTLTKSYLKKKSDMIEEALSHQRSLLDRLENPTTPAGLKPEIVEALKAIQEETNALKDSIPSIMNQPNNEAVKVNPQAVKRTREEMQKQILDAELDLFNQQQEGKDTTEIKKRMLELRTKAQNLGLLNNNGNVLRPNNRGQGRYRATRGKSHFNPHATVDHRPTKLLVSGFESDDKVQVLQHFSKFGEVVGHVWDEATPALVIQFKTRKEAETAMAKGRNFQDRLMSVTWFTQAQNMGMRNSGMRSVIMLNDNVGDLISEHEDEDEALRINVDANEDLLLQDEEDEEDEDRSWRR